MTGTKWWVANVRIATRDPVMVAGKETVFRFSTISLTIDET